MATQNNLSDFIGALSNQVDNPVERQKEILVDFPYYLNEYHRLEMEWYSLRSWQWFKQWRNLHERGKLNKWYQGRMKSWGL